MLMQSLILLSFLPLHRDYIQSNYQSLLLVGLDHHSILEAMALLTPPSLTRKTQDVTQQSRKLTYDEDIYRKRNEDEEFDRFPDECDDETDSDEAKQMKMMSGNNAGFFSRFPTPNPNEPSIKPGFDSFGEVGDQKGEPRIHFLCKSMCVDIH